jgi:MFS family permease
VQTPQSASGAGLRHTLVLLRPPICRWWFGGRLVHVSALSMWSVTELWLIATLTGNGPSVGLTAALQYLPTLLLAPWAGIMADRPHRRALMLTGQALLALLATASCALMLTGAITAWIVCAIALGRGLISAVMAPARETLQVQVVGESEVVRAVALEGIVWQTVAIVGPATAGTLLAFAGVAPCLAVIAVFLAAVVALLRAIDPTALHPAPAVAVTKRPLREALGYVRTAPPLWIPLLTLGIVATFAGNVDVLMPFLARETWNGTASTLTLLTTTFGAGLVAGALVAATHGQTSLRLIIVTAIAWGASDLAAAVAPVLALQLVALFALGLSDGVFTVAVKAQLQRAANPSLRGRVMALYGVVGVSFTWIGDPLVGAVAQAADARAGLIFEGVAALTAAATAGAALIWTRRRAQREP